MNEEQIVLLSSGGQAIGRAPKVSSHNFTTPLHLAFSCYLTDDAGRVLITQRAHTKATFPSVWTNSCCGHPAPGESLRDAVRRRVRMELGLEAGDLTLVLPRFRYRATAADGVVENEMCPVVRASASGELRPDPGEAVSADWREWQECVDLVKDPAASPWFRDQMRELIPLGEPGAWRPAPPSQLPAAVTW